MPARWSVWPLALGDRVAAPHIPPPVGPKYPWWAWVFSTNRMRLVVYYFSAVFAVYCLYYGFTRLSCANFDTPLISRCIAAASATKWGLLLVHTSQIVLVVNHQGYQIR